MLSSYQDTNHLEIFPPNEKSDVVRDDTRDQSGHSLVSTKDLEKAGIGI